jgi:FixJ family two-component response regulator
VSPLTPSTLEDQEQPVVCIVDNDDMLCAALVSLLRSVDLKVHALSNPEDFFRFERATRRVALSLMCDFVAKAG